MHVQMPDLPNKSNFSFNEVCSLCDIKPYVLRFWESEFSQIDPVTNESGQKIYDLTDIYNVVAIKELLFKQKLTIPKVKFMLMEKTIDQIQIEPTDQESCEVDDQLHQQRSSDEALSHKEILELIQSSKSQLLQARELLADFRSL